MKYLILFLMSYPLIANANGSQVCYMGNSCHLLASKSNVPTSAYNYPNPGSKGVQYRRPSHFVDLNDGGTNEYISSNFKRSEFMASHKGRYGILAPHFINRAQKMRNSLGKTIRVTSGYRSPKYNSGVGGAKWSRHQYGDAMDFKVDGKTPSQLKKYCQNQNASFIQLYKTHIHCDWRNISLPHEFYPALLSPSLALTAEDQIDLGVKSHLDFYDNISIETSRSIEKGEYVTFSVNVNETEDNPDDILIEWKVFKNNELIREVVADKLNQGFNVGHYVIQVTVGGNWVVTKEHTIE